MSFPVLPAELDGKAWLAQEKKYGVSPATGLDRELEEVKKTYERIDPDTFVGLEKIDDAAQLKRREAAVKSELGQVAILTRKLSDLDKAAARTISDLKNNDADRNAVKAAEKLVSASRRLAKHLGKLDDEALLALERAELALEEAEEEEEEEDKAPATNVDRLLLLGLNYVRTKPGLFVVVLGKLTQLLLGKRIPPAMLKEARTKCRGGRLFRGRCIFEKNAYVFLFPKRPPGGLARRIKNAIVEQSGGKFKSTRIVVRADDGSEIDDARDAEELVDGAGLDGLAEASESELAGEEPAFDGVAVARRRRALTAAHDRAIELNPSSRPELEGITDRVAATVTEGDHAQAMELLDEWEAAVKEALKRGLSGTPTASVPNKAEVVKRLKRLAGKVKVTLAAGGPEVARIQTLLVGIKSAIDNQTLAQAPPLLDKLEALLAKAVPGAPSPTTEQAVQAIPVGTARLRKSMLAWKNAFTAAQQEMTKAKAAILNDPDFQALPGPQWKAVQAAVEKLEDRLAIFDSGLFDALDDADKTTDPTKKRAFYDRALDLIGHHREVLNKDPVYARIDGTYSSIKVHQTLSQVLTDLASALPR